MKSFVLLSCFFGLSMAVLDPKYVVRSGNAPNSHSCSQVRAVPEDVRNNLKLDPWYQQYTETYGIPIIGSDKVSQQALTRACYTVRYMFAGSQDYRNNAFQSGVKFAIMARDEVMTDIPEQRTWDKSMDSRYRGMSAVLGSNHPTTGAEENLLCDCVSGDPKYYGEDYFLHEVAHTLHLIGVVPADPTFDQKVIDAQKSAKASGKWGDVYGMQNIKNVHHEYFAEAMQAYFANQRYFAKPNHWEGPVTSPEALKAIDPTVYNLIESILPCSQSIPYIDRCSDSMSGMNDGVSQIMLMNSDCSKETFTESSTSYTKDEDCQDRAGFQFCYWNARYNGYFDKSLKRITPGFVKKCCGCSSGCEFGCKATGKCNFKDNNTGCSGWAKGGECKRNPIWMFSNCAKSCYSDSTCK